MKNALKKILHDESFIGISCGCILNNFLSFRSQCWNNVQCCRLPKNHIRNGVWQMSNQLLGKLPGIKKYLQGKIFERFFHHTHIAVSEVKLLYCSIMVLRQVWLKLVFFNSLFFSSVLFSSTLSHLTLPAYNEYTPNWTPEPPNVLNETPAQLKSSLEYFRSKPHLFVAPQTNYP